MATEADVAWSPAIREGLDWIDYLDYDFRLTARINEIYVNQPNKISGIDVRHPKSVEIWFMRAPGLVLGLLGEFTVPSSGKITLSTPLETRFLRIIPTVSSSGAVTDPMAVNGVRFVGCRPPGANLTTAPACSSLLKTTHAVKDYYRSFAVDEERDLLYFCDATPHSSVRCYSSNRRMEQDFDGKLKALQRNVTVRQGAMQVFS